MRLSGTKTGSINQYNGLGDQLYDLGGARPTLDLNFASNGSLVDSVTGKTLVTHTRASNATYVDGDGIIKDAVTNYLKYSENIGFSGWNVRSGTTATANQEAPNGSNTATLITNSSGDGYVWRNDAGFTSGGDFVLSVYAKRISGTPTLSPSMWLGTSAGSSTDQGESVTDEWERYDFDLTRQYAAGGQDYGFLVQDGSVLLWGAQLEKASTVGEYVKTTSTVNSAPRFDHNPETGESLGLLVEESRTNLITNSDLLSDFDASTPNTIIATATKTAPDNGTQVAQLTAVNAINARCRAKFSASSANNITVSAFVKKNTHRYVQIGFGGSTNGFCATFDIELGVANRLLSQGGSGTYTNIDAGYQDYANDWVKIWAVGTTTGTDGPGVAIVEDGTKTNFNDLNVFDGTESIYVWGAQYEDNATFPTSYIRTNGSTVTRAADITQISGNDFGTFNLLQYSEHLAQPYVAPNGWGTSAGLTKAPNTAIAPDGTKTATRLTQPGGASSQFFQRADTLPAGTYTLSVYAKAVSGSVNFALNAWNSTDGAQISPVVTATTEWQRFTHTFTTTVTDSFIYPFVGDGTTVAGDIDFWGAQLEESSTATPYVKSDVTWTSRASNATYYDKDGVLRKSSYNLAFDSENLNASSWNINGSCTVTSGQVSPNGDSSAYLVQNATSLGDANGNNNLRKNPGTNSSFSSLAAGAYTISGYVKGNGATTGVTPRIRLIASGVNSEVAVSVSSSWQRFSVTVTATVTSDLRMIFAADSSDGFYLWGLQVEKGPYAGDYAKTEGSAASTARTNAYLPDGSGNFVSAGELLLEDAGTNLIPTSEPATGSNLAGTTSSLVSDITTPDGQVSTVRQATLRSTYRFGSTSAGTAGTTYTGSIWIRTVSGTGTVTLDVNDDSTVSCDLTETWQRFEATGTHPTQNYRFFDVAGNDLSVYLWGAQLEESPYPTSYIPTYGSTATRAADVSTSSSNTFGNSFYDQEQGTVFVDNTSKEVAVATNIATFSDGSFDNRHQLYAETNTYILRTGASGSASNNQLGAAIADTKSKISFSFANGSTIASLNGGSVTTNNQTLPSTISELNIGASPTSAVSNALHISRLTYWPTRLSNESLEAITK